MKLSSTLVEQTLRQFDAEVIPDDHPALPQLNELFGNHTFFIDDDGLYIVEPSEPTRAGASAKVVNLADWADAGRTSLAPHEPEPTDVVIELGADGASRPH